MQQLLYLTFTRPHTTQCVQCLLELLTNPAGKYYVSLTSLKNKTGTTDVRENIRTHFKKPATVKDALLELEASEFVRAQQMLDVRFHAKKITSCGLFEVSRHLN